MQSNFIDSKLPNTELSIFSQMSALAQQHNAINLSQGFPNYPTDPELIDLVSYYMRAGANQYAPMAGVAPLLHGLARKMEHLYGVGVDAENEITITSGGTQAIFTTIAATIRPQDEVIIFEPAYDCYSPTVELFGGKVIPVRLEAPDFKIDWEELRSKLSSRTRLIILNNPNNPSTKILERQDLEELENLVHESAIMILSDEVYEHLIFDEKKHHSVLMFPGLRERSFVVASFGKLLHTTGWKLGYVVAPAVLSKEFRKVHQFNVFSANTPMQLAIADYLKREHYLQLPAFFQKKRDFLTAGLEHSRFKVLPSEGTYFLLIDYSQVSSLSELDFSRQLTVEHGLASIPVSAFYSNQLEQKLLRLCFAKDQPTLTAAIDLLKKV
ncbi:aminotransferase class I/II-fold pyridoxal phosphate-dependent enzyme [Sphingobacterium shayense]|uniref:methionine aminotransferase n=1 Tax=Sphingobacterium shayense TaxID=626343 RepID=UPI001555D8C5|nr:methionine aminotransferase [Sphingobacterium shayense]NQD71780.1 aminotransferase class I/II-fold pyridoxal phosphate-dependent enzyme [Sphingobacterium shayense]